MQNNYHYGRIKPSPRWLLMVVLCLLVGYLSGLGAEATLVALLASITIEISLVSLRYRQQSTILSPDTIVLWMISIGAVISTLYLIFVEQLFSLYPLPVVSSDVPLYTMQALGLTIGGMLFFLLAYRSIPVRVATADKVSSAENWPRAIWIASIGVLSVIGIYATALFVIANGGPSGIIDRWNDRDSLDITGAQLMDAMPLASLLWIAGSRRHYFPAILHALVSMLFLTITGSRNNLLRFVLACLILLWDVKEISSFLRRYRFIILPLVGLLGLLYISVVGIMRGLAGRYSVETSDYFSYLIEDLMLGSGIIETIGTSSLPSIKAIAQLLAIFPAQVPFLGGESFLAALNPFVPSFIYADFPSLKIGHFMYVLVTGSEWDSALYTTYIGELYLNWGAVGVLIGMAVLGAVCRLAYHFVCVHHNNPWIRVGYGLFVGIYLPYLLTVESLHASASMVFYLIFWGISALLAFFVDLSSISIRRSANTLQTRSTSWVK